MDSEVEGMDYVLFPLFFQAVVTINSVYLIATVTNAELLTTSTLVGERSGNAL